MPSFQSPEPISGRPCSPNRKAVQDGPHAVLVQAGRFFGAARAGRSRSPPPALTGRPSRKGTGSSSTPVSPVREDVAAGRQRQPEVIVGAVRAHAAARGRMPPVLHVAFPELARRAEQQMLAQKARLGVDQRHRVLQLIAEAEGAARLVVSAARPEAARQRLVEQPAVGQHVEGRVGRFHLHGAERVVPVLPDRFERRARRGGSAEATRPGCWRRRRLAPAPSVKTISRSCPSASSNGTWIAAQGSRAAPTLPESRARAMAAGFRSVPLRPRNSVRSPVTVRVGLVHVEERDPVGELGVVGVAREERAAVGIDLGDHVHRRFRPQIAQHPFHIAGGGEPARSARLVSHLQHRRT